MKRTISSIMMLVLFLGLFAFTSNIRLAKATGPVYIRSDGSVDPPTAPIQRDGDIYTLTGNIDSCSTDGIIIERDGITVDGAGYAVQGLAGSNRGVFINQRNLVAIVNLIIMGFDYGIDVKYSTYIGIHGNNVTNNRYYGIQVFCSNSNNVTGNYATGNLQGILVDTSTNIGLYSNFLANNSRNLGVFGANFTTYAHSISTSNTVNGKPVYYWINGKDASVPSNAGYVALINCTRITVEDLELSFNNEGLLLYQTTDSIISGNTLTNNWCGIELENSTGNTLTNNVMLSNLYNLDVNNLAMHWGEDPSSFMNNVDASNTVDGKPVYYWIGERNKSVPSDAGYVALVNCTGITVEGMNITSNGSGVVLAGTTNSTVAKSRFAFNYRNVWLSSSTNNTISENNIVDAEPTNVGISLEQSFQNRMTGNNMTNLLFGIVAHVSSNNTICYNNFVDNDRQIRLCHDSAVNHVYHNNFINTINRIILLSAGGNLFDAGYPSGGNYWSDYGEADDFRGSNQSESGSDGIGDAPLVFDTYNTDHYPLMGSVGSLTPSGENVTVFPVEDAGIIFKSVTAGGSTIVNETTVGPLPESGYKIEGRYFDIETTATYSDNITLRIIYDDANMTQQEEESLRLMRWNETTQEWEDITTHVDLESNVIYGATSHLSIFGVHSQLIHDLSIFGVHAFKTVIGQGYTLRIDVDVVNEGDFAEDFDVSLDLVAGDVNTLSIFGVHMIERSTTMVTFAWNTAGFAKTSYTIEAQVSQVPYEMDMSDNTFPDATAKVTVPGDVTGDFFVNIQDATQIGLYWMKAAPPAPANADINGDGIVNIKDATIVGANWLEHA